ncbi:MAG TPA: response regulator transcription factor [Flavobacteriales bacterium]|nr:response regulator transcription factor [Flavobacteriales bacterium]
MKCIIVDDDPAQIELLTGYVKDISFLELVGTCVDAIEAIAVLEKSEVDLIFLDIQMPKISGLNMIRSLDNLPQVILVTSSEKHAITAFDQNVDDYLLKPIAFNRFLKAVNKTRNSYLKQKPIKKTPESIFIKVNSVLEKVRFTDILFIKADEDYVNVHLKNDQILVSTTMNKFIDKLPKSEFIRVHRSYIVRLDKIEKIDGQFLLIKDEIIKVSRTYKEAFFTRINTI